MKKRSAIAIPTAKIIGRTITKKTIFRRIIVKNKGIEGPIFTGTNGKMQEI